MESIRIGGREIPWFATASQAAHIIGGTWDEVLVVWRSIEGCRRLPMLLGAAKSAQTSLSEAAARFKEFVERITEVRDAIERLGEGLRDVVRTILETGIIGIRKYLDAVAGEACSKPWSAVVVVRGGTETRVAAIGNSEIWYSHPLTVVVDGAKAETDGVAMLVRGPVKLETIGPAIFLSKKEP